MAAYTWTERHRAGLCVTADLHGHAGLEAVVQGPSAGPLPGLEDVGSTGGWAEAPEDPIRPNSIHYKVKKIENEQTVSRFLADFFIFFQN